MDYKTLMKLSKSINKTEVKKALESVFAAGMNSTQLCDFDVRGRGILAWWGRFNAMTICLNPKLVSEGMNQTDQKTHAQQEGATQETFLATGKKGMFTIFFSWENGHCETGKIESCGVVANRPRRLFSLRPVFTFSPEQEEKFRALLAA